MSRAGYDLLGLITGSEGLLCVITEVTVKILKKPDTVKAMLLGFPSIDAGTLVMKLFQTALYLLEWKSWIKFYLRQLIIFQKQAIP